MPCALKTTARGCTANQNRAFSGLRPANCQSQQGTHKLDQAARTFCCPPGRRQSSNRAQARNLCEDPMKALAATI